MKLFFIVGLIISCNTTQALAKSTANRKPNTVEVYQCQSDAQENEKRFDLDFTLNKQIAAEYIRGDQVVNYVGKKNKAGAYEMYEIVKKQIVRRYDISFDEKKLQGRKFENGRLITNFTCKI